MLQTYKPEGMLINTKENKDYMKDLASLEKAIHNNVILEGQAILCDTDHNLIVKIGDFKGIIPREETAIGIAQGVVRDIAIITRVNKPVCFQVVDIIKSEDIITPVLSRRKAQIRARDYLFQTLNHGDVINAVVTHLEPFGAFVDIGCGIVGLITIDNISISRINHPSDRFYPGQMIYVAVQNIDYTGLRISLTHKELLGTWEENAAKITPGQTVTGIIRSVESYGVFVELFPNLAGLAEYAQNVSPGDSCAVYIKNILPEKLKIKLSIIDTGPAIKRTQNEYYITSGRLKTWKYSPDCSEKVIQTVF